MRENKGDCVRFDYEMIGEVIRSLRKEKGLSQDVLSGLAGIGRTYLTMIENGKKNPNFETIWKIALALELKPSELVKLFESELNEE